VGIVLLRRILRLTRNKAATPPLPTEADRLLRVYRATHADVRELLDEARELRRAAA
jgi:hypothetical protein